MKRRALLVAGGAWLAAAAARAFAQAPKVPRRIAVLFPGTQSGYRSRFEAFRSELKKLGYVEGRDNLIEARWAEDRTDQLAALAAELVALGPAVIVTASSAGVIACKKATSVIPIVFATAGTPVEQGFVASLARPGGNVTGVSIHVMDAKLVEMARQALPRAQRLAMLVHDGDPMSGSTIDIFVAAAGKFEFAPVVVRVRRVEELAQAFDQVIRERADALHLPSLTFMGSNARYLIERALAAKLPLLSASEETTAAGGLLSYGTDRLESYRRTAVLVDKILRGAKPGDLPVEQPERFQLVVNLKTAKAIGVTLSPVTMLRATKVIE
ncbi:MAG: ABC transporter substrate-binding protein [Pseudomonadota bacterium]